MAIRCPNCGAEYDVTLFTFDRKLQCDCGAWVDLAVGHQQTKVAKQARQQHGPWQIVQSHEVYRDPWIAVRKDDVIRPDGQPGTHSVITIKPGVCVLAMDDGRHVYLTEEFHYGVRRTTIEAVSGGIEPDEDPLLTAKRELREELGIEADDWTDMGIVDPFTANVVSPTRLYLARKLAFGDHAPEGTEQIRCLKMPLTEAVHKVMVSEITHGPSSVLILKTALLLG